MKLEVIASLLLLTAAGLTLGSCASETPPPLTCDAHAIDHWTAPTGDAIRSMTPGAFTPLGLNTVHFEELDLAHAVMVSMVAASRGPTGEVTVTTRLVNCGEEPVQVEGRTHFMGADQVPTEPVSAWQRVFIPARSVGVYQEKSVSSTPVADFLIEIRRGT